MSDPIRSISQNNFILADQKEVSHDNTLSGNGTEASPLGLNETVLWSGFKTDVPNTGASSYTLSELATNFETIRIEYVLQDNQATPTSTGNSGAGTVFYEIGSSFSKYSTYIHCVMNGNPSLTGFNIYDVDTNIHNMDKITWDVKSVLRGQSNNAVWFHITKIVGINRIANN